LIVKFAALVEIDGTDALVASQPIDRREAVVIRAGGSQRVHPNIARDQANGLELEGVRTLEVGEQSAVGLGGVAHDHLHRAFAFLGERGSDCSAAGRKRARHGEGRQKARN
jgi:hypothetical protein